MIHKIYSNLPTFKNPVFKPGLNLVIVQKSAGASQRQTRNAAGKSSLIELINFLFASDCDATDLCRKPALIDFTFGMEVDLGKHKVSAERSGAQPSRIYVASDDFSAWQIQPKKERSSNRLFISNSHWRTVLGQFMFGLEEETGTYGPKFRSLFSYFARRQSSNGFLDHMRQSEMQQVCDQQVAISFLVGLDWTIARDWQKVRDQEKEIKELRKSAAAGLLGEMFGTAADLRTKLAKAEKRVIEAKARTDTFRVVDEYHQFEREASALTIGLNELSDGNTVDQQLITQLEEALKSEAAPSITNLESIYAEVGVVLPEVALKRYEDVKHFHESVIENRKTYLSQELAAARERIAERVRKQRIFDERRAELMQVLNSGGAFDQLTAMHLELSRLEAKAEDLRKQFDRAETIEGKQTKLEIERQSLRSRLQQDYHEQSVVLREAILTFEEISNALLEMSGSLTVNAEMNGPSFEVKIHADGSKGIGNMNIFCFDLMLTELLLKRGRGPGFLIHDSHIFDGVDGRQKASALQVGAAAAKRAGFQYIVTMNSDEVPVDELPKGFVDEHLVPVDLSDASETGGLFGFRFD